MAKRHSFSLYDIEQFLRDAGAERVNEKALLSLERELQDTLDSLINEASVYANYAGRKRLIKSSDIALTKHNTFRVSNSNGTKFTNHIISNGIRKKRIINGNAIKHRRLKRLLNIETAKVMQSIS